MADNSFQVKNFVENDSFGESLALRKIEASEKGIEKLRKGLKEIKNKKVVKSSTAVSKPSKKNSRENKDDTEEKTSPVSRKPVSEKEIAMDFAVKVQKKFDRLVKSSILFGSQAKDTACEGSDIDIILIVDDASINWDAELVAWYREELAKLIAAQKYAKDLHINTVRITTWWEDLIHGDPVVINILRYGEPLVDYGGFFNPMKALLLNGKIRSTPEAVYAALQRAPWHIARSKASALSSIEGVYWAMVDSAHAALITAGKLPPSPEHMPQMLHETFVETGLLKSDYVKLLKEVYEIHKAIAHGVITSVKGQDIDRLQKNAEEFLSEMTKIIDNLLEATKE